MWKLTICFQISSPATGLEMLDRDLNPSLVKLPFSLPHRSYTKTFQHSATYNQMASLLTSVSNLYN